MPTWEEVFQATQNTLNSNLSAFSERSELLEENRRLVETLQFYANPDNYKNNGVIEPVIDDYGQRARDILKERL